MSMPAFGPLQTFRTVRSPTPFALSLPFDKLRMIGTPPFALSLSKGFDKLSPNGDCVALRYLRANGTVANVRKGPIGDSQIDAIERDSVSIDPAQEALQHRQRLLRLFFGHEVAAVEGLAVHVLRHGAPIGEAIELLADDTAPAP